MNETNNSSAESLIVEVSGLEPGREIRPVNRAERTPTAKDCDEKGDTLPYRPLRRPPTALVCVLFDGREDGEWVRLCKDSFLIGRNEGDVTIPHDDMMSGRHAEITRLVDRGVYRWYLNDLQSRNGTFVRIGKTLLRSDQEFIVGSRRFRFRAPQAESTIPPETSNEPTVSKKGTVGWQPVTSADVVPSIVEVTPQGEGKRWLLTKQEYSIGREQRLSSITIAEDPMISPRHATLHRDPKGRWILENSGSLNGTWLRIAEIPVDGTVQFLLGEQRFILRIP